MKSITENIFNKPFLLLNFLIGLLLFLDIVTKDIRAASPSSFEISSKPGLPVGTFIHIKNISYILESVHLILDFLTLLTVEGITISSFLPSILGKFWNSCACKLNIRHISISNNMMLICVCCY